jgi:hypothetical protein
MGIPTAIIEKHPVGQATALTVNADRGIGFEIAFKSEDEAYLFEEAFCT